MADPEEKLCRLASESGRICERRKLRVNVGKSKVMRCLRYGDRGRMHAILNGEPLEEMDCFMYLESQVAADGKCENDVVHKMNEGYRACMGSAEKCAEQSRIGDKGQKVSICRGNNNCTNGVVRIRSIGYEKC